MSKINGFSEGKVVRTKYQVSKCSMKNAKGVKDKSN